MTKNEKQFPKEKFSTAKTDSEGRKKVVVEHPFIMFDTGGREPVFYHQKFNAYYSKPGTDPITDPKKLEEIHANMRWAYSKLDKDGKETFPASSENIGKKRSELAAQWSAEGKEFSAVDVMKAVSPTDYLPKQGYIDAIEQVGGDQQLNSFRKSLGLR